MRGLSRDPGRSDGLVREKGSKVKSCAIPRPRRTRFRIALSDDLLWRDINGRLDLLLEFA